MKKYRFKTRKLGDSENAVAGIIVALLMIGLMISAISFVQLVYVPMWMEKREAEHMDDVGRQFSQLKFAIDTLSISEKQSSITSPITLGSKEMPFLASSRSYGSIDFISDDFVIEFEDHSGNIYTFSVGSLKYTSKNAYFIDQSYVFENGAVILSQEKGEVLYSQPNIFCDGTELSFNLIKLVDVDGETSLSGFGTYPVQTRFSKSDTTEIFHTQYIRVYNSHLNAWGSFFNDLLLGNDKLDCTITSTTDNGGGIIIEFIDTNPADYDAVYPYICVNEDIIKVKISPGVIN